MESERWLCNENWGESRDKQTENARPDPPPPSQPPPNSLASAQLEWEERRRQLTDQHRASIPHRFFEVQAQAELEWQEANQMAKPTRNASFMCENSGRNQLASKIVFQNWDDWGLRGNPPHVQDTHDERWMHEMPCQPQHQGGLFGGGPREVRDLGGWGRTRDDNYDRLAVGVYAPPSEDSRPFAQFISHVSLERIRVHREANSQPTHPRHLKDYSPVDYEARVAKWEKDTAAYLSRPAGGVPMPPDINTICFDRVRAAWKRWGVWDGTWGLVPGMVWQHERPLEDFLRENGLGECPMPEAVDLSQGQPEGLNQGQPEDSSPEPRSFRSAAPTPTTDTPKDERSVSPHFAPQEAPPQLSVADNSPTQSQWDSQPASARTMPGGNPFSSIFLSTPPCHCPDQREQNSLVPARRGQQTARSPSSGSDADVSGASSSALGPIRPGRVSKTPNAHHRPSKALEAAAAPGLLAPKLEILDESQVPDSPRRSKRLLLAAVEKESIKVEEE